MISKSEQWQDYIINGGPMPQLGEDWPEIPLPEGWPFEADEDETDEVPTSE